MKLRNLIVSASALAALGAANVHADTYEIDTAGGHASINFRVSHLGFSWLEGRFDDFEGRFTFDEKDPSASAISVTIDPSSVNSNHAERDNHIRGEDFLFVEKHGKASFTSKRIERVSDDGFVVVGDFTLRGVTKEIEIEARHIAGGDDPWGNYRQGFVGTTSFAMSDFGIPFDLGPASKEVFLTLNVEGIKK